MVSFSQPLSGETELSRKALKPQGTMTADPRSVSSLTASKALFASSSEKVDTCGRIFYSTLHDWNQGFPLPDPRTSLASLSEQRLKIQGSPAAARMTTFANNLYGIRNGTLHAFAVSAAIHPVLVRKASTSSIRTWLCGSHKIPLFIETLLKSRRRATLQPRSFQLFYCDTRDRDTCPSRLRRVWHLIGGKDSVVQHGIVGLVD
jgi:hypothetical protein